MTKHRIWWINGILAVVLVAALVGGYLFFFHSTAQASTGRTVAVQQGTVSETITATGTVANAGTVTLSFADGGTVDSVKVAVGDTVTEGEKLATVDDTAAQQSLESARQQYTQAVTSAQQDSLSLTAAQESVTAAKQAAELNKQSYDTAVKQARENLADAKASWSTACLDPAQTCPSTDAWAQLRNAEAQVTSAKTAYNQAVENATNDQTTQNLKVSQAAANVASAQAKAAADCAAGTSSACTSAQQSVTSAQQSYDNAVNSQKLAAVSSQQNLVNADAKVTSANVNLKQLQASLAANAADSVEQAQQSLDSAILARTKGTASDQQSILKAEQSLASLQASNTTVDTGAGMTSANEASISIAQASVASAKEAVEDTVMRSPVDGTVAAVAIEDGAAVQGGTTAITILPDAGYEVVASFSEADSLKLQVGQEATVTFDALSGESATGKVTSVDILPTTGGNVTTYNATITITDAPDDVRDGMSASVVVTIDSADDVLWVPTAAVTTAGGLSTVTVRKDGVDTVVQVTTGLAGDSGTEITSGVSAGDQVVISTSDADSSSGFGFPGGGIPGGGGGLTGGGPGGGAPAGGGR